MINGPKTVKAIDETVSNINKFARKVTEEEARKRRPSVQERYEAYRDGGPDKYEEVCNTPKGPPTTKEKAARTVVKVTDAIRKVTEPVSRFVNWC